MYSAYDGTHAFTIPAIVSGQSPGTVTWSSSNDTLVQLAPNNSLPGGNGVLIVVQGAGTVDIIASANGKCGSSLLNIRQAASTEWDVGNARYNNGKSLVVTDGGMITDKGGPACTNCHGPTATNGKFIDIAHTPEQTGGFTDNDLIDIFINGNVPGWQTDGGSTPDAGYFDPQIVSYSEWHSFHQWTDITMDEQLPMVTYLRSLTPMAQTGTANFGGGVGDGG
jgi:hypothetical protein